MGDDQTIRIWNADNGDLAAQPINAHSQPVKAVAFGPNGAQIATISADGELGLWQIRDT